MSHQRFIPRSIAQSSIHRTERGCVRQLASFKPSKPPSSIEEYQVGWVCALPKELTAARALLNEEHKEFKIQVAQDDNSYVLGRIHEHNVVLACLPAGVYGTVSAATVANNMVKTFTGIRFGLMVGIGGGIPNLSKGVNIRLSDVVVSQPDGTNGGVIQYDLEKNLGVGLFKRKGFLNQPPTLLLTALSSLQSKQPELFLGAYLLLGKAPLFLGKLKRFLGPQVQSSLSPGISLHD